MILNALHLENYKQYRLLDLEFREGLVGIVGKNGAGKSTIFEAILYCLFGRDESNKSLVRSSFADPKSTVLLVLQFSIGERLYRVRREFRGKALATGAELFRNDELVAKGTAAVNEEIARVLHMERDAFKRSVFSGQKELSELSDTTGEARKRMVRKMLGLDTLDDVQKAVNTDRNVLENQAAGQRQNLLSTDDLAAVNTSLERSASALKDNLAAFKKEEKRLKDLEAQYRSQKARFDTEEGKMSRFNTLNRELGQIQERIAGLSAQQESLQTKQAQLEKNKAALDQRKGEYAGYVAEKKMLDGLEEERRRQVNYDACAARIAGHEELIGESRRKMEILQRQLAASPGIETDLQEKQQSATDLEALIESKRDELRQVEARLADLGARIRERSEKVASLENIGKDGTCPTCFQPLLDSYERVLAELNRDIQTLETKELAALRQEKETVTAAGIALKNRQQAIRKEVEGLLKEQSRLAEIARQQQAEVHNLKQLEGKLTRDQLILREIGAVHFDEKAYLRLKTRLAELEPKYMEFSKEENYVARELPAVKEALKKTAEAIAQANDAAVQKDKALAETGFDEAQYREAKQALTGFDEALGAQSAAVRNLEKRNLEIENDMARSREKLRSNERIAAQISDKLAEIEVLEKLSVLLGQFKTDILERVSPSISREASDLFSRITKGKYESILVDENFDFSIADGGVFYPIERFSGGEIDLANFCLRIAVTKAIMELSGAGQGVEFLAFDEIFGSQDEERRYEMMLALNYLQEQFRQIYIVSHIESLKDFFPHILEVRNGSDGSEVLWR